MVEKRYIGGTKFNNFVSSFSDRLNIMGEFVINWVGKCNIVKTAKPNGIHTEIKWEKDHFPMKIDIFPMEVYKFRGFRGEILLARNILPRTPALRTYTLSRKFIMLKGCYSQSFGASRYVLSKLSLEEFKGSLSTIEEIEVN